MCTHLYRLYRRWKNSMGPTQCLRRPLCVFPPTDPLPPHLVFHHQSFTHRKITVLNASVKPIAQHVFEIHNGISKNKAFARAKASSNRANPPNIVACTCVSMSALLPLLLRFPNKAHACSMLRWCFSLPINHWPLLPHALAHSNVPSSEEVVLLEVGHSGWCPHHCRRRLLGVGVFVAPNH